MIAKGDPQFIYRAATSAERSRGWLWVTGGVYVWPVDPLIYPTLADMTAEPLYTTAQHAATGAPYAVLGREHLVKRPSLWITDPYAWDGATGGTEVESGRRGSCVHDALYQIMRSHERDWGDELRNSFREDADRAFLNIQQEDGMSWWRRRARWLAVRTYPGNIRRA